MLQPTFRQVRLGIARTIPTTDDEPGTHEIEQMYLDMIASARHFIYAESQYFAARKIARAIAQRLSEPDGPEIVIINPTSAEGWLEPVAMDGARAQLVEALRDDLLAEHLGVTTDTVAHTLQQTQSLIATIEQLRRPGRTLVPYVIPELSEAEAWLADNEILDPEGPEQFFEPLSRRGLFRKWRTVLKK